MIGLLKDFDDRGEINLNIFYFKSTHGTGHIYSDSVAADGGTYC